MTGKRTAESQTVADQGDGEVHRCPKIKENYTSHWDLDQLPRAELERLANNSRATHRRNQLKSWAGWGGAIIAAALAIALIVYLFR